jgi:small subunit ribosomal protein S4
MSRYTGPRLRIVRRLGGSALPGLVVPKELRRAYPPGQHGPTGRVKLSDYAIRLREKQKLRYHYGIAERQFRLYMSKAKRSKGNTGENLLILLESRLDNVVYRLGYARTLRAARQIVRHGHIAVDGECTSIPSYQLSAGQVITVIEGSKMKQRILEGLQGPGQSALPSYLERGDADLKAVFKTKPEVGDCPLDIKEALVVELYALSM